MYLKLQWSTLHYIFYWLHSSSAVVTDEGTEESRWYRFNDTVVDEFVMNDAALAAECFGGTYKSKAADGSKYCMMENSGRVKYW